jgi:hypothetical protein
MKKLNLLLITGLVLLFTCGTALAWSYKPADSSGAPSVEAVEVESERSTVAPVPEPTTMLLLGTGLAVLAVGARKKKK